MRGRFPITDFERPLYQEAWVGMWIAFLIIMLVHLNWLPKVLNKYEITRNSKWLGLLLGAMLGAAIAITCELTAALNWNITGRWLDHITLAIQWGSIIGLIFAAFGIYSTWHPLDKLKQKRRAKMKKPPRNPQRLKSED